MNVLIENLPLIISYLAAVVGGVWAYFTSKKVKTLQSELLQKEVEDNALDNTAKNMRLYQDMMDDIKKRFEQTIDEYRLDVDRLKVLLDQSRETIGRQEVFLREKNQELDRLRGILGSNQIDFKRHEE